jgi:outer membrane protein OmpA-like peptidoglycan-associated protein
MGSIATSRAAKPSKPKRIPILAGMTALGSMTALALMLGSGTAAAQSSVFVGTRAGGDVSVDLGALDALGPPARLPSGVAPSGAETEGLIVVHPPSHKPPAKKVAAKAPKKKPARESEVASNAPAAGMQTPGVSESTPPTASSAPATPPTSDSATASATASAAPAPITPSVTPPAAAPATDSASAPLAAPPPAAAAPAPAEASTPTAAPMAQPAPAPAPMAQPAPEPTQVASAPPAQTPIAAGPEGKPALSLNFAPSATDLADADKTALGRVVDSLKKNPDQRVELLAYATGGEDQTSQSRRVSLIRGLSVRTYLIEQGISSARIDVRALGNKIEGSSPVDRVDLVLTGK